MIRAEAFRSLATPFDVLIIGGGATGLGLALDSVTRGFRTAVVEAGDFAQATSSRSTKLVHGGVRYLATGQIHLVREALQERAVMLRNAPHLVRPLPTILPAQRLWELPWFGAGLTLYDALSGASSMGPTRLLSRNAVLDRIPGANPQSLTGGVLYHDGQFNDARYALMLAVSAADHGATVLNYTRCERLLYSAASPPRVFGALIRDTESATAYEIQASVVINAAGIFSDELRAQDEPARPPLLRVSRGTHIVVAARFLGGNTALMIPKTTDGRVVFALPWEGVTVIGTTDLPASSPAKEPGFEQSEVDYLLAHIAPYLSQPIAQHDILSVFSGLRPLVTGSSKTSSRLSREHHIDRSPSGLINIAGGKWTTYRRMAEDTLNFAMARNMLPRRACVTRELALHGSPGPHPATTSSSIHEYGADAAALQELIAAQPALADRVDPELELTGAMVVHAVQHEFARTVEDVLSRRSRALLTNARAARRAAPAVANLMQQVLGTDPTWGASQVAAFRTLAQDFYLPKTSLTEPLPRQYRHIAEGEAKSRRGRREL